MITAHFCSDALLFSLLLSAFYFDAAYSLPAQPHRENIILNSDIYSRPEYVEALAKELEKESIAAYKNQEVKKQMSKNLQSDIDVDVMDPGRVKKLFLQRNENSPSDTVIFPGQLYETTNHKRNFDEIDHSSGFSGFNRKRNFDEIDRTTFSNFNRKRNFDEIDRSGFSGFNKRNFDEIDRTGFSGFNRKRNFDEIDRAGFSGFNRKRNLDEIDQSGFSGFNKRNLDEFDKSGIPGFAARSKLHNQQRH